MLFRDISATVFGLGLGGHRVHRREEDHPREARSSQPTVKYKPQPPIQELGYLWRLEADGRSNRRRRISDSSNAFSSKELI